MAKEADGDGDGDVEYKMRYVGSHETTPLQPIEQTPTPPSPAFAQSLALSILGGARGRFRPSGHFVDQATEREFDVFDVEYVIRNGKCVEGGIYCEDEHDYQYTFRGCIDGVDFDAVFALSAEHDFFTSPLMILVTGCWKTKSGKRNRRF